MSLVQLLVLSLKKKIKRIFYKKSISNIGVPPIAEVYWWTTNSKGVLVQCEYKRCISKSMISSLV